MKNIIRTLKLVIPIAPLRMTIYLLLSLPGAILPAVLLYLQRKIVDRAASFGLGLPLSYYMVPVLFLIGTYMIQKMFELVSRQYMEFGYFRYVFLGLDAKIHEKSAKISLEHYDSAQYFLTVEKAKQASMFLVFTANLAIMSLVLIFNLISVGGYLVSLHPLLILFVVMVSVPVILEKRKGARYQSSLMQDLAQAGRRKSYALGLLSTAGSKKELAHHGASCYVAERYLAACREADEKEGSHIRKMGGIGLFFAGIRSLFHSLSIFLMVWLLVTGRITIGGFSVLLASFAALTGSFTQLFDHAGEILQTNIMSASFFELMDLEVTDGRKKMEPDEEVARLEHVSYRYPNEQSYALKDISLSIQKGERIAIVGENGAGKTTLAKLLSGFLLPSEGVMELGGVERSQLEENSIYEQISAVYQEFGRYKLTLAQNVYLGDTTKEMDHKKISHALEWAGILLGDHPQELLLGREFGGTELSGGQWQRLALARSHYRQRPILFLDEPTAAIDPLEEMAIYQRLHDLAQDRTVVLVTHRLGAVRGADKILVLNQGSITEAGSFEELMEQRGYFYHIWNEQAKWYREG